MDGAQATAIPTPEEEQRAKWDLLLTDVEYRLEQLRQLKGIDLEYRSEQTRQLKGIDFVNKGYEFWKLILQAIIAFATVFAAGGVVGGLIVRLMYGG